MITVQPITKKERPVCAYCDKGMQPRWPQQHRFENEEALAAFKTDRRVYALRRQYTKQYGEGEGDWNKIIGRKLYNIEISLFPDKPKDWGYDGVFCTMKCAYGFAYAAHRGGYRITRKQENAA